MKWIETITPKQAAEELGVPYHGWMREMDRAWISEDQKYSVMSRLLRTEWGKVEHVTITAAEGVGRSDGSGDIPWAVKMEIKTTCSARSELPSKCSQRRTGWWTSATAITSGCLRKVSSFRSASTRAIRKR